jgi:hypothetical protein
VPSPANPQSLNRYSYCLNNPLKYKDPTGHREIKEEDENGRDTVVVINGKEISDPCTKSTPSLPVTKQTDDGGFWGGVSDRINTSDFNKSYPDPTNYSQAYLNGWHTTDQTIGTIFAVLGAVGLLYARDIYFGDIPTGEPNEPAGLESTVREGYSHLPRNVAEQLAIDAAKADPEAGFRLPTIMNDAKNGWTASEGWVKMQTYSPGGIEVHYNFNTITGATADFKIIGK